MVIMASSVRYAELHLHLEGTLDEITLHEIAPHFPEAEIKRRYQFTDFSGFLDSFKFAAMQLRDADHYRLLARRCFARLAGQGIVYAELIHSAGICLWRGLDARMIAEALVDEGQRAPLQVRWVFDAVRQLGADHILETAKFTAQFRGTSVLAFGVGGDERGAPAEALRPAFDLAREQGFRLVPHAGETSNAQNVWDALSLGSHRIGHGIRAIEDPALVAELSRRNIPLEISLTSNVLTGAVPSYEAHPAKLLHDAGVPIILNTDDPAFFKTTLSREFELAQRLGFSAQDLETIRLNAFRFAFGEPPLP